ncbi:hypothetical protein HNQ80_004730 [Anaerosolibacter carboniphilus]|uniref:Uncharacterized protein n=1 Tax=Anaerosolibacter carboniphilus TaxID=1417629 RepID=A0A841KXT0_9FIRM|nr:hypothetical protein [Anaerosolibacter carboniphilus]MBB6218556.1 hypothetical protein [Anaerosolibacter carboniphilus]
MECREEMGSKSAEVHPIVVLVNTKMSVQRIVWFVVKNWYIWK